VKILPIFLAVLVGTGAISLVYYQNNFDTASAFRFGTNSRIKRNHSRTTEAGADSQRGLTGSHVAVWKRIAALQANFDAREVNGCTSEDREHALFFWLENLYNNDPEISGIACAVFECACREFEHPSFGNDDLDRAASTVHSILWVNFIQAWRDTEEARFGGSQGVFRSELWNKPEYNRLIGFFAQRAQLMEYRISAVQVLNALTFNLYDTKNADWWKNEYPNSKLAAICEGKLPEEWIKLKE
jgi:hypothetical protein